MDNKNNVEFIIPFILQVEGGYVNNPADPGGETKYGISKRRDPGINIKNLTVEDAKAIYKKDYWEHFHCNLLPFPINMILLDATINSGLQGVRTLQQAVNLLSKDKIAVDGIIGPITVKTVYNIDANALAFAFLLWRVKFYYDLSFHKGKQFFIGWVRRVVKLAEFLYNK